MIVWLVALPLIMALVVLLLRGFPVIATPLSAATFLVMAILFVTLDQAKPLIILGRSLSLSPQQSTALALCSLLLALMMLYTYRVPQGPLAHPLTLGAVSLFVAATMVENMTLAGLFLEVGMIVAIMLIPSHRAGTAMTGMRTLILLVLSSSLLLLAAWTIQSRAVNPDDVLLTWVGGIALIIGFGIALAIVPLHVWLPQVFQHGSPLAAVMFGVVLGTTVLLRLDNMLRASMWPGGQELFSTLLLSGGIATCLVASIAALPQRSVGRILAYAAIADMGIVLIGWGTNTRESLEISMLHLAHRGISIVVVSMALGILKLCLDEDDLEHLRGSLRCAPLATIGMAIGGFSLVGLPPTAGFVSRFALYRTLVTEQSGWTLAIIACSVGPAWAFMRCTMAALMSAPAPGSRREPLWSGLLTLLLSLVLLTLGVYPQILTRLPTEWFGPLLSGALTLGG